MVAKTNIAHATTGERAGWVSGLLVALAAIAVAFGESLQGRDAGTVTRLAVFGIGGLVPILVAGLLIGMALWDARSVGFRWSRLAIAGVLLLPVARHLTWAFSALARHPISILDAPIRFYSAGSMNVFACLAGVAIASTFRTNSSGSA